MDNLYSKEKIEEIRQGLHSNILGLAERLVPEGKQIGDNWVCGDLYGNKGKSFNLCVTGPKIGSWYDFQMGSGGDVYGLIRQNMQLDFLGTMDFASDFAGIQPEGNIVLTKKDKPRKPLMGGPPEGSFIYKDHYGMDVIAVHRREGKKFAQMSYDSESRCWDSSLRFAPSERPIYNLQEVIEQHDKPIIFHEGEGCVNQAIRHGLHGVHTTTIGGANNPHKSNLSVVENREVYIVPDNDKAGSVYAENLTELLSDNNPLKVSVITLPDIPDKGDIVQWLGNGGKPDGWRDLLSSARVVKDAVKEKTHTYLFGDGMDPGPFPQELLTMPGFIDDYTKYIVETSIYPNMPMAFAAALPMMGFLTSGRITDRFRTQTNIYVCGIAPSGSGKNRGRIVNKELAEAIGAFDKLGEQFGSSEGIEEAMLRNQYMLYQNDEINHFFDSTHSKIDSRNKNTLGALLRLYGDSGGRYSLRTLAKDTGARSISRPSLSLFGTAVPEFFYESMSFDMLTNGFFSRNMIIESTVERRMNPDSSQEPIPPHLVEAAQWWNDMETKYYFSKSDREQLVIEHTPEALELLISIVEEYDSKYRKCVSMSKDDPWKSKLGSSIWNRAFETINKLALLCAASKNYKDLKIDEECINIANNIYYHQASSNLYNAGKKIHINLVDKEVTKAIELLEKSKGLMKRADMMRKLSYSAPQMRELQATMVDQGIIEVESKTAKTKNIMYIKLKGYIG